MAAWYGCGIVTRGYVKSARHGGAHERRAQGIQDIPATDGAWRLADRTFVSYNGLSFEENLMPISRVKDKTGKIYGNLEVISFVRVDSHHHSVWKCLCLCGNETEVPSPNLVSGSVKSCGCGEIQNRKTIRLTHGHKKERKRSPEYASWQAMKSRCMDKNNQAWKYYGGRGITVCERWINSFENFLADMGKKPSGGGWSIDRFPDNDGNYEPGNCRWATQKEQMSNTRTRRSYLELPANHDVLHKVIQFHSDGDSYSVIAKKLNNIGISSPRGKKWEGRGIKSILRRIVDGKLLGVKPGEFEMIQ